MYSKSRMIDTNQLALHISSDKFIAVMLSLTVLILISFTLDNNCSWGDDFAAYLSEGIAIAEGCLDEQAELNIMMHLTPLPEESQGKPLVYAWGYPLLHSLIYKIVGFDRVVYDDLIYYKLPTVFAYSGMVGLYYLLCRIRFGKLTSVFLSGVLCLSPQLIEATGSLYTDALFMSLTVMAVYMTEKCVLEDIAKKRNVKALLLGALLWYIYCVRLNGIVVVLSVFFALIHGCAGKKKEDIKYFFFTVLSFAILYFIFNVIVFPKPSALSGIGDKLSITWIKEGIHRQFFELSYWYFYVVDVSTYAISSAICKTAEMTGNAIFTIFVSSSIIKLSRFAIYLLMGASIIGMLSEIKTRPHLVFLVIVSFVGTSIVNLIQGLRYLYVILPFVIFFSARGLKCIIQGLKRIYEYSGGKNERPPRTLFPKVATFLWAIYIFVVLVTAAKPVVEKGIQNLRFPQRNENTAYSEAAIDMYNYIQKNVAEDDTIAFFKPRALYLNTRRHGLSPYEPQYEVTDTDYYLYYHQERFLIDEDLKDCYDLIYGNEEMTLYKKTGIIDG